MFPRSDWIVEFEASRVRPLLLVLADNDAIIVPVETPVNEN